MVLPPYKKDPANMQAKINVVLSATPTISLSDPAAEVHINLMLSIDSSTKEGQPITIMTDMGVFEVYDKEIGGVDIFAQGGFGYLRSTQDSIKDICLGLFRIPHKCLCHDQDLKELGFRFITIPGDGSTVTVTHQLNWERIFRYEKKRCKSDLVPGERFKIGICKKYFGTMWWCWGDLETDLKDKKLHTWRSGPFHEKKPDDDLVREGNWVLGEGGIYLDFQDVTEDGWTSFEVVA